MLTDDTTGLLLLHPFPHRENVDVLKLPTRRGRKSWRCTCGTPWLFDIALLPRQFSEYRADVRGVNLGSQSQRPFCEDFGAEDTEVPVQIPPLPAAAIDFAVNFPEAVDGLVLNLLIKANVYVKGTWTLTNLTQPLAYATDDIQFRNISLIWKNDRLSLSSGRVRESAGRDPTPSNSALKSR